MVAVNEQYRGIAEGGNAPCLGHLPFSHDSSVIQNRLLFVDRCSLIIERSADAFGIKIAGAGSTPNQILYSGEFLDPGTGNYDLRARVYDQSTGTFLTRDTYAGQDGDPITLHQYLYAGADPVNMSDPSGRFFSIPEVVVDFTIELGTQFKDVAVATYIRSKEIETLEILGVVANGLANGYENLFFGPNNLSATAAFSIGFGAGIVQGLVALDSPATAAGLAAAITDVGNETFSTSHQKFSWQFFGHLAADEVFAFGATAFIERRMGILTEGEKFFLSADITQAYLLAPGIFDFAKSFL